MEPVATSSTTTETKTLRIFISSPGDVNAERDKAKQVIAQLQKWYGPMVRLVPVLWEDLPLEINASFQKGIDVILSGDKGIDIAVFILWSRIGTPVTIGDKHYNSGTEREFDMMLEAQEASGGERPDIIFYRRDDDDGFTSKLAIPENANQLESLIAQRNLAKSFVQEHFWDEDGQNTRAYHSFQQPVEFAGRLKVHLQGLIDKRLENFGLSREATWADAPYRGLEAFDLQHADIFFGREKEVVELESRLRQRETEEPPCAFVAVIGASGSGKSSLVRAGLRANLTRFNLDETVSAWRSAVLVPAQTDGDPLAGLLRVLAQEQTALPELSGQGLSEEDIIETLQESPPSAIRTIFKPALARAAESAGGTVKLLIIIDQFEELFTDKRISAESRDAFLTTLEALAQSGLCWVVITMRSDFYSVAQKSEIFLRLKGHPKNDGQFDLLAPGPEALRRIITEPARMAGLHFERRAPELGGQSVVGKILEDAKNQPDMLPLLSDLLLELYQRRTPENMVTFAAYESLGDPKKGVTGLEGALSTRADKEFDNLTAEQQKTCPEILHALVTVEADADVRRRANLAALKDTPQKAALVDAFINARLLTADGPSVSLAHEALLRKWDRVADWVRDNRQHLRIRSRVEQAMRRWQSKDQHPTLLLSEGLDLEEGVSLLKDAPQLLAGSEYDTVRDYITLSQKHVAAREKRTKRLRRTVTTFLLLLTGLAVWRTLDATQQRDDSRSNEAQARMLQAEVAVERGNRYPDTLFYAARAIGFDGVGRDEKTGKTPLDFVGEWFPTISQEDETPRLWSRWKNPEDYERARKWIRDRPGYLPVWSSALRESPVTGLAMSPEGKTLALSTGDGGVRLWDFATGEESEIASADEESVTDLAFHPNGNELAVATADKLRFWDLEAKTYRAEKEVAVTSLAYSPGGQFLAGSTVDGSIMLWNGETQTVIETHQTTAATNLSFSPDDSALAAVYRGVGLRLFFHHYGKPHLSWAEHQGDVSSVAFSPDGLRLAMGAENGLVSLWEVASARQLGEIVPQQRHATLSEDGLPLGVPVLDLSFRYDGKQLASASADRTVKLWNVETDVPDVVATLTGHTSPVSHVLFAPGGRLLASAGADGSAKLWNVSGKIGEALPLFPYLAEGWYRFDPKTQEPGWEAGSGFLNLPADSVVGRWHENQVDGIFARLKETRNWAGATLVATDAQKPQLAKAIIAEAGEAADQNQLSLARLRLAQVALAGVDSGIAELQESVGTVAAEGTDFTNGDGMDLIWCPEGEFMMGEDEDPGPFYRHNVILSAGFWIGKYEVTQAQYEAVMGTNSSTYRQPHAYLKDRYTAEEWSKVAPAENMDWHEAMEFCRKLTDRERARGTIPSNWEYSLPTEAQWEYACRAGTTTTFYFGDEEGELHKYGNYNDASTTYSDRDRENNDGNQFTAPVGSYPANEWGLHDVHGNVREWCRDSIDPQNADYPAEPVTDPFVRRGPFRVSRGGGFLNTAAKCRSAYRNATQPSFRSIRLGLRPCLVPSRTVQPNQDP